MSTHSVKGFWPVVAAIGGNAFVTVIKFVAASVSGSSAMFSEAIHSLTDTVNQTLLFIGLHRSLKKADEKHEYGYGRERFFWALVSACGVFFVGAGVTFFHSMESLLEPHYSPELSFVVLGVLGLSLLIEGYTLIVAIREAVRQTPGIRWRERLEKVDTSTVAVLLEDSVAVLGVLVAAVSIFLSYLTGNGIWDALGSLVVSFLLAFVAIVLILKNREYLIGVALPDDIREEVIALLSKEPSIEKVIDFKSSALGFGIYRIKCEVEFNGAALTRSGGAGSLQEHYDELEGVEDFKKFTAEYADRIPRLIGKQIDEIEAKIKKDFPMIRHIDIEIN